MDLQRLSETIESLREGVQILTPSWRYLYLNEAAAAHSRKLREELIGKSLLACFPGIEQTRLFSVLDACMRARRSYAFENEFEYGGGERAWFDLRIEPCPEGLTIFSLDISERKQLEASLEDDERLRALGQTAANIGHDLRGIYSPLALDVRLLLQRTKEPSLVDVLKRMEAAIQTGDKMLSRLLPLHEAGAENARSAGAQALSDSRAQRGRILVVEDEPMALQALAALLIEEGYAVAATSSAGQALATLETFAPDLVLADFRLPDGNAAHVAQRARAKTPSLPVIIMTGIDEAEQTLDKLLHEPRTQRIVKPIDMDALLLALERLLRANAAAEDSVSPSAIPNAPWLA